MTDWSFLKPDLKNRTTVLGVLVQNFVFCTGIALLLWLFFPTTNGYGFWSHFVHSQMIGNSICLMAIGATYLFSHFRLGGKFVRLAFVLLIPVVGAVIGLLGATWLLGIPFNSNPMLLDTNNIVVNTLIAITASIVFASYLGHRQRLLKLELAASEQTRRSEAARHAMLQAQLEPHMLFNTLANLRALISTDTDRALEMLDRLDYFLRETLSSSQTPSHTLEHEFKILENYLSLMKVRFGDRLHYTLTLSEECKQQQVPSLLLQPLVENSIRHGIEPQIDGGNITVLAACSEDAMTLSVSDTGIGYSCADLNYSQTNSDGIHNDHKPISDSGFGLANLKERLTHTYGRNASFTISHSNPEQMTGCKVTLILPHTVTESDHVH